MKDHVSFWLPYTRGATEKFGYKHAFLLTQTVFLHLLDEHIKKSRETKISITAKDIWSKTTKEFSLFKVWQLWLDLVWV